MPTSPTIIVNLAQRVGEDKSYVDTIFQSDGVTPQDITGWSVTFLVHKYGDATVVLITKTVGSGITLTTPASGVMTIAVNNADTIGLLPNQTYEFSVCRTDAGNYAVLSRGAFTVLLD